MKSQSGLNRNSAFLSLWTGETISQIGSAVTMLALPLTAIILLHAAPWQLGLLIALQSASVAGVILFAGVWSDRVRRRPLMIGADIGRAALMASIPLAFALGILRIEWLYAVIVLDGALDSIFGTAYQAFLPTVVPERDLAAANGRLEGSRVFAQVIGPGLAGALIQIFQAPFALLADAASFLVSALGIGAIRRKEARPAAVEGNRSMWREIGQGLQFTFTNPLLRAALFTTIIFNFFAPMLNAQAVLFAVRDLGLSPLTIGLWMVIASVGGVLAAFFVGGISRRLGSGVTMVLATFLISSGWLIVPFVQRSWAVLVLPLLVIGTAIGTIGDVLYNVNSATLRQTLTPDRLRGRVTASIRVFIFGAQPLGAIAGGVIGSVLSVRLALLCAGGGFFLGFLCAFFSPLRGMRQVASFVEPAAQ
jgi:MFS family permease